MNYGAKGFNSATEFLANYPGVPFLKVVDEVADWVAAMQLIRVYFQEAQRSGQYRKAAIDGLARELNQMLPDGWSVDPTSESRAAAAVAHTSTALSVDGGMSESFDRLLPVFRGLQQSNPPHGWMPTGPDDPLLKNAFDRAWAIPIEKTNSSHVFSSNAEERNKWFSSRGLDINDFTVTSDDWERELIRDQLDWKDRMMYRLLSVENRLGRKITPLEIRSTGKQMLSEFVVDYLPIHSFGK